MREDIYDIIKVAWSGKKLRNKTIADTVKQATKSFNLNEEDATTLERVLIEYVTGIASPQRVFNNGLALSTAMDYLEESAKSSDGTCSLGGKDMCSAKEVRFVMRNYIKFIIGYRD